MEAVILRQSVQLQMNVVTKPGLSGRGYEASTRVKKLRKGEGWRSGKWSLQGKLTNASWTAPHKQVAVASFSLDQLVS